MDKVYTLKNFNDNSLLSKHNIMPYLIFGKNYSYNKTPKNNKIMKMKTEIKQEIILEIIDEIKQEIIPEIIDEIKQEITDKIKQEIKQEIITEIKQEMVIEIIQEIMGKKKFDIRFKIDIIILTLLLLIFCVMVVWIINAIMTKFA